MEQRQTVSPPEAAGHSDKAINILILDDCPIVRYGIKQLLELKAGTQIIAETSSCETAWDELKTSSPHVLLMDIAMKDGCAHKLIKKLSSSNLATRILLYSAESEEWQVLQALSSGAHGFISKDAAPDLLSVAVRDVVNSGSYLDPAIAAKVISQLGCKFESGVSGSSTLTPRESDILKAIASGKRNRDIAAELSISERTVKYHLSSMYNKLGVHNRTEAVKYAYERGLVK